MEIRKGIAVSPGVAIAGALMIDSIDQRIPRRSILPSQKQQEIQRVDRALEGAVHDLSSLETAKPFEEGNKICETVIVIC
jgi:phosphotransferase system enzyme I (PtsI)